MYRQTVIFHWDIFNEIFREIEEGKKLKLRMQIQGAFEHTVLNSLVKNPIIKVDQTIFFSIELHSPQQHTSEG